MFFVLVDTKLNVVATQNWSIRKVNGFRNLINSSSLTIYLINFLHFFNFLFHLFCFWLYFLNFFSSRIKIRSLHFGLCDFMSLINTLVGRCISVNLVSFNISVFVFRLYDFCLLIRWSYSYWNLSDRSLSLLFIEGIL